MFLVATNIVASRLPERQPTGTPTTRANFSYQDDSYFPLEGKKPSKKNKKLAAIDFVFTYCVLIIIHQPLFLYFESAQKIEIYLLLTYFFHRLWAKFCCK